MRGRTEQEEPSGMMQKPSIAILRNGFASQFSSKGGRYPWVQTVSRTPAGIVVIIFIPKFRRKTFFKEVRKEVGEILRTLCEYKNVELVKRSISADHVHMYVKIPPKLRVH